MKGLAFLFTEIFDAWLSLGFPRNLRARYLDNKGPYLKRSKRIDWYSSQYLNFFFFEENNMSYSIIPYEF